LHPRVDDPPQPAPELQAGFITGAAAALTEAPIDFYKSQIQVQIIRSKADSNYKREHPFFGHFCADGQMCRRRRLVGGGAVQLLSGPRADGLQTPALPCSSPPAAPYTSVGQCVRATIATSGWRGPFQGLGPTLLRNAPANAIYLGSFEIIKHRASDHLG
jgi:solute carrier family 25 carnitine/acylcarnitine transporter 20/29